MMGYLKEKQKKNVTTERSAAELTDFHRLTTTGERSALMKCIYQVEPRLQKYFFHNKSEVWLINTFF